MATGVKFTTYVPEAKGGVKLLEKLQKIADKRDRALNYIVVEALRDYIESEWADKEVER